MKLAKNDVELKKGNTVEIFSDPLRELSFEGKAKLLNYLNSDGITETWEVQFPGRGEPIVRRRIRTHKFN